MAAEITRDCSVRDSDQERDQCGYESHHQADSAAIQDAREQIAAERVGSEQVFDGRVRKPVIESQRVVFEAVVEVHEPRSDERDDDDQQHNCGSDDCGPVPTKSSPCVLP